MTPVPVRPTVSERTPALAYGACILLLLVGCAAVLHYTSLRGSLWEDEIIALTHTFQPLPSFFVGVMRNDIHPFFFFLVLKGWMVFAPASAPWALASSLAFTLLSVAVIYCVSRAVHGAQAALWAVVIYLLLPTTAWAAGNLRMYALMPALVVAVWYLNLRFLRAPTRWSGCALLLLQLCTAYTHAIAFIFVAFIALSVLIGELRSGPRTALRPWLALQVLAGVLMLPLPMSALVRGTEPLAPSQLDSFYTTFAQTVAVNTGEPLLLCAGLLVFAMLVALAMQGRTARITTLGLPVGVLLVTIGIGFLGKPMFKSPVFSANLLPFLAIGAGAGVATLLREQRRTAAALACAGVALLACITIPVSSKLIPEQNYQAAASYLSGQVQRGDTVVVPHLSVYWAVMLYSTHRTWGEPLAVRPADNPQWQKITQKLGPALAGRLGLIPGAPYVDFQGVRYCTGTDATACTRGAARVFIVDRRTYNNGVQLATPMRPLRTAYFSNELAVTELRHDPQGSAQFDNPYLTRVTPTATRP